MPQLNGSSDSASGLSSSILNSEGLSEASAVDNSSAETTSGTEPTTSPPTLIDEPKETNVPRKSSFDVDDLQLESLAISDLEDRYRDSREIREEKESKRRLQLAAEKRRREESQARKELAEGDDYNLLPVVPAPAPYTMPSVPMLSDDLLPKQTAPRAEKASSSGAKSTANTEDKQSKPSSSATPNVKVDDLDDLDSLVPELEDVKPNKNSLAFFDDVVEDKYRIACPICGTIQYVGVEAKGSSTKCPDCYSKYTVPPPPANWVPSKIAKRHNQFDTDSPLGTDDDRRVVDRHRKQATSELLEKAETDLEHEKSDEDRYGVEDFDTATFMRRTFGFFRDPVAMGFIFGYSLVFALVFSMVQYGISHSNDGEFGKGAAFFCVIVGPLVGLLFGVPMISAALAQLEAVANHQSKVVDWPGFDMFENLGDIFSVAMALGTAAIPGFILGSYFGGGADGSGRIQLVGVLFSIVLLFPIFLLSILDNGSLIMLVSRDVLRSMREVADAWAGYYLKTALFVGFTSIAWFMLLGKGKSAILGAVGGAFLPVVVFFLFQQVGALADLIAGQLSFSFEKPTKEASDDGKPEDLEDSV